MQVSLLWLIFGVTLCALEVLTVPGFGLLFGGLAAMLVAVLVELGVMGELSYAAQVAWWFGMTCALAALLWKPLKNFYTHKNNPERQYNNIVGERAVVAGEGLVPGVAGLVQWSGTLMQAELVEGADALPAGAQALIVDLRGATLIVK